LITVGMFRYFIKSLNKLDQPTLLLLDELVVKTFPNSLTLQQIKNQYSGVPFSVFYVKNEGSIILCSLIFSSRPTLYLYYISVPKEFRSTGVFKRALIYLKAKFIGLGYKKFALDASEEKDAHMNQKKRIQIFLHLGFRLSNRKNPSPFVKHADPKTYVLTNSGKAELLEVIGNQYIVLLNGEKKTITLNQIKGCVADLWSDIPDLCPMIMQLPLPRNKTRRLRIH